MKGRQPFGASLKYPFLIHNLALTIGSGALLAVMLEEIIPILRHGGLFYGICHEAAWTAVSIARALGRSSRRGEARRSQGSERAVVGTCIY